MGDRWKLVARKMVRRRSFLQLGGLGSVALLSGCADLSTDGEEQTDSEPPEPTTPESATYSPGDNLSEAAKQRSISVDTTPFQDSSVGFRRPLSHVTSYSYAELEVQLNPDSPEFESLSADTEYVVEALAYEYTSDKVVGSGESEGFEPGGLNGETQVQVPVDFYEEVLEKRLAYLLAYRVELLPSFQMTDYVIPAATLGATNPFQVTDEGVEHAPSEHERESDTIDYSDLTTQENHPSNGSYTRLNVEGGYHVYFSPDTPDGYPNIATELPFYIPKLIYDSWKEGDRVRRPEPPADRTHYVTESFERGIAKHFANIVSLSGLFHGASTDREQISFASTFVQSLPYALDRISTGYRDYSRYPAETLVDARGDCVDTSILLCVALLGGPIDCEVGFFSFDSAATSGPAGHLAVAISPENATIEGPSYRIGGNRYYYIEPTAFVPVGVVPTGIDFAQGELHPIEKPDTE